MLYIGSHVGFKNKDQLVGSVMEAVSYGANTFMFYTGAPQNTKRAPIDKDLTEKAFLLMQENKILPEKVIVHAPYIINLANNKEAEKYDFSISFLKAEVKRCEELGIKRLVLHPGSHVGLGKEVAIENISFALNQILGGTDVTILLETMAGKGTEVASTIDEVKQIIDKVKDKEHIGVCLDTCHLNDSGYDMGDFDSFLEEFDKKIGIEKIGCVHINDSKNPISSHKDRHENLGFGTIGFETLLKIIYNKKIEEVPKILETPYIDKIYPPYKYEIDMIIKKEFNKNILQEIRDQD